MTVPTVTVLRGLPAAGKTTLALRLVAEGGGRVGRVSRDDVRRDVFGLSMRPGEQVLDAEGEAVVTAVVEAIAVALLSSGVDVVADSTHLSDRHVARWEAVAERAGAVCVVRDLAVPVDVCVERDAARAAAGGRSVGAGVIEEMARSGGGTWERPTAG